MALLKKKLGELDKAKEYDSILKQTEDFRLYYHINSNHYVTKILYRIKTLILYGRFQEAEQLCLEALNNKNIEKHSSELINNCIKKKLLKKNLHV